MVDQQHGTVTVQMVEPMLLVVRLMLLVQVDHIVIEHGEVVVHHVDDEHKQELKLVFMIVVQPLKQQVKVVTLKLVQ